MNCYSSVMREDRKTIPYFRSVDDLGPTTFVIDKNLWKFDHRFHPTFTQKMKAWLDENNIQAKIYDAKVEKVWATVVEFETLNDAMLFKLTWSDHIVT